MYFVDRMGDTYRWKGENVSTVEVESVISSVLEQVDCVVYGVDVPGVEGKAGMAAIVEDAAKFDLESFLQRLKAELPSYSIPLFLRLVSSIDITGNYNWGHLGWSGASLSVSAFQELSNSENLILSVKASTLPLCRTHSSSITAPWEATPSSTPAFMTI